MIIITYILILLYSGLFCGLFSGILPLYLSELAPKNLRGTIGTLNQLMIVFGILVTNILGLPQLFDIYIFVMFSMRLIQISFYSIKKG